ncbi:MAG: flagellar motor switch protein FliM [Deltaproteobacteria bacterium]
MREILTQEEVSTLIDAHEKGELPGESPPSPDSACAPYDFLSKKLIGGVQQTILEIIQESFSKGTGALLSGMLHREIQVAGVSNYSESVSSFLSHFQETSCIGVISSGSHCSKTFLAFSGELAYSLIDLLLGGDGTAKAPPDREFSPLELRLAHRLLSGILAELTRAWSDVVPTKFTLDCVETTAKRIPLPDGQEQVYVMNLRITTDTDLSRDFCVALPLALIEPLKSKQIRTEADPEAGEFERRLRAVLETIPVEVSAELGETQVPIRRILSLHTGDVLPTDHEIQGPVIVKVEGFPKMTGGAGLSRGKRAIKITST